MLHHLNPHPQGLIKFLSNLIDLFYPSTQQNDSPTVVSSLVWLEEINFLVPWTHVPWMLIWGPQSVCSSVCLHWTVGLRRSAETAGWLTMRRCRHTHLEQLHQAAEGLHRGLGQGPLHGHVHGGLDDGADAVGIQDSLEKSPQGTCCCTLKYLMCPRLCVLHS